MSKLKRNKINQLLRIWPRGTAATSTWLKQQGIRFDLAARYKKSGWVESLGHGAFRLAGDPVQWPGALYAMQTQLGFSTHPAGKTALALLGKSHYVPMASRENVVLFSAKGERLPKWFLEHEWKATIRHVVSGFLPNRPSIGFTKVKEGGFEYTVSSAERAILEFLYDVPGKESPEEARQIFEGLMTLRPNVVSELLMNCSSVKVKRLFVILMEMHEHPWAAKVNISKVDLGKGNRMLVKNGFLHTKYHITVPVSWKGET